MNDTRVKTTINNEANQALKNVRENDTIVIIIRNGEVICCTQNELCVECAYKNQA